MHVKIHFNGNGKLRKYLKKIYDFVCKHNHKSFTRIAIIQSFEWMARAH